MSISGDTPRDNLTLTEADLAACHPALRECIERELLAIEDDGLPSGARPAPSAAAALATCLANPQSTTNVSP